jgi:hypothetical protein
MPRLIGLLERVHRFDRVLIDLDDHFAGAHGLGRQERSVEHQMRNTSQQQMVLEAGRLGLRSVDDHTGHPPAGGHRAQLGGRGKVGAPAPAQAAALDRVDQPLGGHLGKRTVQLLVADQVHRAAAGL